MTREEFKKIFEEKPTKIWETLAEEGDNALRGLNIIAKYMPKKGIEGADHDIIYSVNVDELVEAGIIYEDVRKLVDLNWMIQDDYLACFV